MFSYRYRDNYNRDDVSAAPEGYITTKELAEMCDMTLAGIRYKLKNHNCPHIVGNRRNKRGQRLGGHTARFWEKEKAINIVLGKDDN